MEFGSLKRTGVGRVDQVLDGLTILLKDKKIIRLSSLDIPDHAYPDGGVINLAAKNALEKLLPAGTEVLIYQTRMAKTGRTNRMGQDLAHLVKKEGEIWINGALVRHGYARVMPSDSNPDMTEELYALENEARAKNLALWSGEGWPVLTPETAAKGIGEYRLVEGTVESAATVKNNLYLNFGKNWKEDFTIMIPPAVRRDMARRGIDAQSLAHTKIRARGYIRDYNGPYMELENDLRLEFAHAAPPTEPQDSSAPSSVPAAP
jgi:endonuclease YncB( thermonuclease family)